MSVVESEVVFPEPMKGCGSTALKVEWRLAPGATNGSMFKGERVSFGVVTRLEIFAVNAFAIASRLAPTGECIPIMKWLPPLSPVIAH
jgi:hypothetical protein